MERESAAIQRAEDAEARSARLAAALESIKGQHFKVPYGYPVSATDAIIDAALAEAGPAPAQTDTARVEAVLLDGIGASIGIRRGFAGEPLTANGIIQHFKEVAGMSESLRTRAETAEANALSWQGNCQRMADQHGELSRELGQAEAKIDALVAAGDAMHAVLKRDAEKLDWHAISSLAFAWHEAKTGAQVPDVAMEGSRPMTDEEKQTSDAFFQSHFKQVPDAAELARDKARKDWLVKERARVMHRGGYYIYWGDTDETDGEWQTERYDTPDAAIDAAMGGAGK